MPFWNKKTTNSQTFSDLVRGLQHSVNTAMEMLEARNLEMLGRYFTEDGVPRVRRLTLNESTVIDVPVISIVNPSALCIDEMEMEFSVRVNDTEVQAREPQRGFLAGQVSEDLKLKMERADFVVSFNGKPGQSTMDVKIKFKATPIPESKWSMSTTVRPEGAVRWLP